MDKIADSYVKVYETSSNLHINFISSMVKINLNICLKSTTTDTTIITTTTITTILFVSLAVLLLQHTNTQQKLNM